MISDALEIRIGSILQRLFTSFVKRIAMILCLLFLAGCGTSVNKLEGSNDPNVVFFKLRENNRSNIALVYVYRPFRFGSGLATPTILVSGERAIILRNQHHTVLELHPGVHKIETCRGENWIRGRQDLKTLSVESGHRYYVRVLAETRFFLIFGVGTDFPIEFIEEDRALPEIRETLYQPPEQEEIVTSRALYLVGC
jgi:hypothetical protein